jgi:hypothetical protein
MTAHGRNSEALSISCEQIDQLSLPSVWGDDAPRG